MSERDWTSLIDELSAQATEARTMLSEVRSELKEARRVIRELRHERDEAIATDVRALIDAAVKAGLDDYADTLRSAMDSAVAHITSEFDKLFDAFMKGGRKGTDLRDLGAAKRTDRFD